MTVGATAMDRLAFLARSLTGTDIITSRHSRFEAEMRLVPTSGAGKALVGAEDGGGEGERARCPGWEKDASWKGASSVATVEARRWHAVGRRASQCGL